MGRVPLSIAELRRHLAAHGRRTNARTDTTALPAFATSLITLLDSAPVT